MELQMKVGERGAKQRLHRQEQAHDIPPVD